MMVKEWIFCRVRPASHDWNWLRSEGTVAKVEVCPRCEWDIAAIWNLIIFLQRLRILSLDGGAQSEEFWQIQKASSEQGLFLMIPMSMSKPSRQSKQKPSYIKMLNGVFHCRTFDEGMWRWDGSCEATSTVPLSERLEKRDQRKKWRPTTAPQEQSQT